MANPDLEELLNALLPFALQLLAEHGEFFPFAATMKPDGTITAVAGDTGDERPSSQEVLDVLVDGFRDQASRDEIKAAGVCLDVRVSHPDGSGTTDAVCARLEHLSGEAVEVYLPYKKTPGGMEYGDIFAGPGKKMVFGKAAT